MARSLDDRSSVRLVAFPYHDWRKADQEGLRWRDAHLIETFARMPDVEDVLVVDRPVSLAERLRGRQPAWAKGQLILERSARGTRARVTQVRERVRVLDIHVPDLVGPVVSRRAWWFDTFADERVLDQVRWATTSTDHERPSVIAWLPTVAPAIAAVDSAGVLFDSLDNWLIHPGLRQHAVRAAAGYAAILPTATAVVASAPASRNVLRRWVDDVELIPNGVEPAAFEGPHARPLDLPAGPIVGYAGSLAARVDARLVATVARSLPDVSFVFIGQTLDPSAIAPMRDVPNVRILGDRHYGLLPSYLANFDVAWIPHAVGAGESGGDPIKMYEYWAAHREVVSTPIDGLDRWSDRLHLVGSADDAVTVIRGLLDGSVDPKHAVLPQERTWAAIADRMVALLRARQ
jgi:hypothetical protein